MAQSPLVQIASHALAAHKKVEILAASRKDWTTLVTIDEPQPGIVHLTTDGTPPMDFYIPSDSISGIRVVR